jgi:hypothetical protein
MPQDTTLARLARNIGSGFRVTLLRPVAAERFAVDIHQVVLLGLVLLAWRGALDYARVATQGPLFDSYAFAGTASLLLFDLLAAYLIAHVARRVDRLPLLLVVLLAVDPSAELIAQGASWALRTWEPVPAVAWALWGAVVAWFVLILAHVARIGLGIGRRSALLLGAGYFAASLGAASLLPEGEIWYAVYTQEAEPQRVDVESLYYAQDDLLRGAFDGLAPQRRGVVDLYFVGFGGDAGQDVFLREASAVQRLFDARFDTAGRSLLLLNNGKTAATLPLANAHNLARALAAVAQRMDATEDVLFLFLTSHGSEDHRLAVDFWPLGLNDLPAPRLRELLDASGIRNRVVVVSACYSGGFIDALRDDHTLVLTAAAADRQSFGCAHENDFTYFGKAYFDQALRRELDFTAAFALAEQAIAQREAAERLLPSQPQMAMGTALGPVLERLTQRLQRRGIQPD